MVTGKYLCVIDPLSKNSKKRFGLCDLSKLSLQQTLFRLDGMNSEGYVNKNDYVQLKSIKYNVYLGLKEKYLLSQKVFKPSIQKSIIGTNTLRISRA